MLRPSPIRNAIALALLLLQFGLMGCRHAEEASPSPAALPWPPEFTGEPIECSMSVKGAELSLHAEELEPFLGKAPSGQVRTYEIYDGPILVEMNTDSSDRTTVDCIFSEAITLNGVQFDKSSKRAGIEELLGPPHTKIGSSVFYRVIGNERLEICYADDGSVVFFAPFAARGPRARLGRAGAPTNKKLSFPDLPASMVR